MMPHYYILTGLFGVAAFILWHSIVSTRAIFRADREVEEAEREPGAGGGEWDTPTPLHLREPHLFTQSDQARFDRLTEGVDLGPNPTRRTPYF